MPTKKPRGEELPLELPVAYQALPQCRRRIEHGPSSVKRGRSVQDRSRLWQEGVRDLGLAGCWARQNCRVRLTQ